jgi:transposase
MNWFTEGKKQEVRKMSFNIRPYNNKQLLLFPPSVGDYLSKNHLAHIVDEAVESIDLTIYYRKISSVGNPAYDPALMIKIWFYGYCVKAYSSRRIAQRLESDVAFIYLSGMQRPDFRTISDFRKNNISELKKSFVDILHICHRLGLTELGIISLDSKVMKANASVTRSYDEKALDKERQEIERVIQDYLEKSNQTDEEEDRKYGSDKSGNELPEDIQDRQARIKKMKQIIEQLKSAQEELKISRQNTKRPHKEKINLTDTGAKIQKGKGGKYPGYRAQISVDSREQVIIANDVTNDQHDVSQLIPMGEQTVENVKEVKKIDTAVDSQGKINLLADSGYSSAKNLAELKHNEKCKDTIEPYIADRCNRAKNTQFGKSKFTFQEDKNKVLCPCGKELNFSGTRLRRNGEPENIYQCPGSICKKCQHFGLCTNNEDGRTIQISENEMLVIQMRKKLSTPEGKKIYSKRSSTVEPTIGNLSHNLGFKEFYLRGLHKVTGEFSLMCTAHNILKIAKLIKSLGVNIKEAIAKRKNLVVFNTS